MCVDMRVNICDRQRFGTDLCELVAVEVFLTYIVVAYVVMAIAGCDRGLSYRRPAATLVMAYIVIEVCRTEGRQRHRNDPVCHVPVP